MNAETCLECAGCPQTETSKEQKSAGILSDDEIKEYKIISDEDNSKSHNPSIYDLRLGHYHYLYSNNQDTRRDEKWKAVYIGKETRLNTVNKGWEDSDTDEFTWADRNDHTKLVIPALGSALIELLETIDTDSVADRGILVTGRFDLKLGLVNRGLISQQGTQIEPCYKGKMYCFIHNLSGEDLDLYFEQPIASIEFSYVSCYCNKAKREEIIKTLRENNKKNERYAEEKTCNLHKGIKNIRYFKQRNQLPDTCGLAQMRSVVEKTALEEATIEKIAKKTIQNESLMKELARKTANDKELIESLKKTTNNRLGIWQIIGTIAVALITGLFTFLNLKDRIDLLKEDVKKITTQVEKLESSKKEMEDYISSLGLQITENDTNNSTSEPSSNK